MAELLLEKGYEVHGMIRRSSNFNTQRIEHVRDRIHLHYGDVSDMGNVVSLLGRIRPTEIYNFAAMSHVKVSFEMEDYTFQVNTLGVLNILNGIRTLGLDETCRVYQASTSEMYGRTMTTTNERLDENTEMRPVSPYGISKLAAHHLCNYYRDAYGMYVVSGILLNHESERRGPTFVTKKIADHVGRYYRARNDGVPHPPLELGNLDARRDWGYAKDYVHGIWLSMQQNNSDNYVMATEESHSVREFVEMAFRFIDVEVDWMGERGSSHEYAVERGTDTVVVRVNPRYYRPIDIDNLRGDATKAFRQLGWRSSTSFQDLVERMVTHAIDAHHDMVNILL